MTLPRLNMLLLTLATVALTASARTTFAQEEEPDSSLSRSYRTVQYRGQVDAVNVLADQLGEAGGDLETLYQLSRLLSSPCDQLSWLHDRIEGHGRYGTDDATRAAADAVLTQIAALALAEQSSLRRCQPVLASAQELLTRIAEPPIPWEIIDPDQLADRWRGLDPANNDELQRELTPSRKLVLASRGVPSDALDLMGDEPWKLPERIAAELAATPALPTIPRLLQLDEALRSVESNPGVWTEFTFPGADTARIARGLLDRALGVDALDRLNAPPSADYAALAATLEERDLWTWAALARCLQAADSGQVDAINQARAQWQKASRVSAALGSSPWPAFDDAPDSWLNRLASDPELTPAGSLPLSPNYRADTRQARRNLEEQFLHALNDPAEAFRLIQLAKAAGVGRDPRQARVITPGEIQSAFEFTKDGKVAALKVFALLEMIAVERPGQSVAYYGVLMNVADWSWTGKAYDITVVGPSNSPVELVRANFDERYKELRDLRLMIGVDGPLDETWFTYEHEQLSPYAGGQSTRGEAWLVYLPSLAALSEGAWPLEDTLRHFHRAALSAGRPLGYYARAGSRGLNSQIQPQIIADLLDKAPLLPLYALSFDDFPAALDRNRPRGFIRQLNNAKSNASPPLPVMLVFAGQEG